MIIPIIVSGLIFFVFVVIGVYKFGLLSAYSAYAQKWKENTNIKDFNPWTFFTFLCAILLMPPLLEFRANTLFQFTGFLAPISLALVSFTPDYEFNKSQRIVHNIGAWGGVGFVLIWSIINPKLFIVIGSALFVAIILSFVYPAKRNTYIFWGEMAMYVSIYINLILLFLNVV